MPYKGLKLGVIMFTKHIASTAGVILLSTGSAFAEGYVGGSLSYIQNNLTVDADRNQNPGIDVNGGAISVAFSSYAAATFDNGMFAEFEFEGIGVKSADSGILLADSSNHIGLRFGKNFSFGTIEAYAGQQTTYSQENTRSSKPKSEVFGLIYSHALNEKFSGSFLIGHTDNSTNQAGIRGQKDDDQIRDFTHFGLRLNYGAMPKLDLFLELAQGSGVVDTDNNPIEIQKISIGAEYQITNGTFIYVAASQTDIEQSDPNRPNNVDNRFAELNSITFGVKFDLGKGAYRSVKRISSHTDLLQWKGTIEGSLE